MGTICFISNCQFNKHTGGIDRVCFYLIEELYRRGYEIVCCYSRDSIGDKIDYVKNYKLPNADVYSEENISFMEELINKEGIDVVLDNSHSMQYFNLLEHVKKSVGFRLIKVQHTDPFAAIKSLRDNYDYITYSTKGLFGRVIKKFFFYLKFFLAYCLRLQSLTEQTKRYSVGCDKYIVLSRGFVEKLKKHFKFWRSSDKLDYIYNPMSIKKDNLDIKNKKNQVIFVGRLDYQKRVDRLLRIWSKISEKHRDWNLVIVGDGDERERLENYARDLNLKNYIFVGSIESKEYMLDSKICCVTSSHEGFSMVVLEAQLYGCVPLVFDSYETLSEIIQDDRLKVQPFKEKQFVSQLDKLMLDDVFVSDMKKKGYQNVKRFEVSTIVDKWEGFILK